jgi:hypothetical protein
VPALVLALGGCRKGGSPPAPPPPPPAPATYTVGGTVAGLSGTVVLANNGGDSRSVAANGAFTFATALAGGTAYNVTVTTQPTGQTCSVTAGAGTVVAANVAGVTVNCVNNAYTIGGTVQGLTGTVVLANNGGDSRSVAANGAFTFATALNNGAAYAISVTTQPAGQSCTVASGSGTVAAANVSSITVTCAATPVPASAVLGKVGATWRHTCALRNDATLACWGYNSSGQLGRGDFNNWSVPFVVNALAGVTWVDAGDRASCAVFGAAGNVACSGDGQSSTFVNVQGTSGDFTGAQSVAVGSGFKCLVTTAGAPMCWGRGFEGQLGNNQNSASFLTPQAVWGEPVGGSGSAVSAAISSGVSQIVGSLNHGCLLRGGVVQCWGMSDGGANGSSTDRLIAGTVLVGATSIDTGDAHTCAVMADQTVQCWGSNSGGQLGLGAGGPGASISPMTVPGLTGVVAITTGVNHTCALRTNGRVSCWGAGNTVDAHLSPFEYPLTGFVALSGGFNHTCALRSDKTMQCWGSNDAGQLGVGHMNSINGGPNTGNGTVTGGAVFWGP